MDPGPQPPFPCLLSTRRARWPIHRSDPRAATNVLPHIRRARSACRLSKTIARFECSNSPRRLAMLLSALAHPPMRSSSARKRSTISSLAPAGPNRPRTLAHEYAHLVLHSAGMHVPPWFAEGIAEVFSSLDITPRESLIGGDLPARSQVLRNHTLIPLEKLLTMAEDDPLRSRREDAGIFYAESWELTHMLLFSPQYSAKAGALWAAFNTGTIEAPALASLYGRSIETIESDLRAWIDAPKSAMPLPGIPAQDQRLRASTRKPGGLRFRVGLAGTRIGRSRPRPSRLPNACRPSALRTRLLPPH